MSILNTIILLAVAFLAGISASLGLGGGVILILYLLIFTKTPQLTAQGINLIFFIPIAAISLYFHRKNGLIKPQNLKLAIPVGIITSAAASYVAASLQTQTLTRLFGFFVLVVGIKEMVFCLRQNK